MKKNGVKFTGLAAGAFLYAVASPAFAQDDAAAKAKQGQPAPAKKTEKKAEQAAPPAVVETKPKSDREAAVTTVDVWEQYTTSPETVEETFFRLSRDFVVNREDGIHRLGSVPVWPRGELKVAGIRLLPYVREAVEWTNNYYQQGETGISSGENGHESVYTHVNEVGVLADKALAGGRLRLTASLDSVWNIHYNDVADTWDFDGQIGATYHWPSGLWISGGIGYERRHDPADLPNLADDFGRSDIHTFLTFGVDRDIFFGTKLKFEFGIQGKNELAHDTAFSDLDRTESLVYGKASYPFIRDTTRIFVLVDYHVNAKQSDALNDGKSYGVNFGLEGSIPLRSGEYRGLRGQVSVGFSSALYDDDRYQQGSDLLVADSDDEATTANVTVALQYTMSPKSSADLRYLHQAEFSFYGNYQTVDRVDLTFSHNFTRQLTGRIAAFYEHVEPSGNRPAESIPSDNISKDAPSVNREGLGVGFRYAVNDWMDIDGSADVDNRNDHSDRSYRSYRAVLGVTFFLNAIMPKVRTAIYR